MPAHDAIQDAFDAFHAENPHIYERLVYFARQARTAGLEQYGIASLFERLRWHYHVETRGAHEFKLNNNLRSRYARLIMARETDLVGFFEVRSLGSDRGTLLGRDAYTPPGPPRQGGLSL